MSLRVWLPLDGNLNNYGASGETLVTNSGATLNASGKIGSCYYFNNHYLSYTCNAIKSFTECSISLWVKIPTSQTKVAWLFTLQATSKIVFCINTGTNGNMEMRISDGTTTVAQSTGTVVRDNNWHHLCLTYTPGICRCFVDGVNVYNKETTVIPAFNNLTNIFIGSRPNSTEGLAGGYINDCRIYDECLSFGKIKEISQALVLHYPLDSPNDIMKNKYSGENADGKGSASNYTSSQLTSGRGWNYKKTYTGTGADTWFYLRYPHFTFTAGKRYYYSVKVKCNKWTGGGGLSLRASRSDNDWVTNMVTVCSPTLADGKWHEYYTSVVINSTYDRSGTTVTCDPCLEFYTGSLKTSGTVFDMDFDIKDVQVVESDTYIPFIDNGLPQYTIHDCSGYNRNGTTTASTSPVVVDGSPRNNYCYQFDTNAKNIQMGTGVLSTLTTGTITWWCKVVTGGTSGLLPFAGQNSSYFVCASSTWTGAFYHSNIGDATKVCYVDGVVDNTPPGADSKWHFYAITGVNLSSWTQLWLNNYVSSAAWNGANVYYSDVKFYNTVLSANDVSMLYHNFASIYNSGSLASYDMRENI